MKSRMVLVAVGLLSALVCITEPSAAAVPGGLTWTHRSLPLRANQIAAVPGGHSFLATVPPEDSALGNELVEIESSTGRILRHVHVGSNPSSVVVAPSGQRAYVALLGSPAIVEVDLNRFAVRRTFATDAATWNGQAYAQDLEVLPGDESVVLGSLFHLNRSPALRGVAAYQHGVRRPAMSRDHTGAVRIEATASGGLFGLNTGTTAYGIYPLVVDDTGVTQLLVRLGWKNLGTDIEAVGDHLYGTNGMVVDPEAGSVVRQLPVSGPVSALSDGSVAYLDGQTIRRFSSVDGSELAGQTFPAISGVPKALVAVSGGVAALTSDGIQLMVPGLRPRPFTQPPAPPGIGFSIRSLPLPSRDVLVDERGRRVFVTVSSQSSNYRNQVVAVDPRSGRIINSGDVGSAPTALAMSSDRSRLYVALDGATEIAEVNPETLERIGTIPLTGGRWPLFAEDMVAMPGPGRRLVVSLKSNLSPRHMGVTVFSDGRRLPISTPSHTGPNRIELGPQADTVYGANNETTAFGFYALRVDPDGIRVVTETPAMWQSFYVDLSVSGEVIHATDGQIIDPLAGFPLARIGPGASTRVGQTIFTVDGDSIDQFDARRFRLIGSQPIPHSVTKRHKVATWEGGLVVAGGSDLLFLRPGSPMTRPRW